MRKSSFFVLAIAAVAAWLTTGKARADEKDDDNTRFKAAQVLQRALEETASQSASPERSMPSLVSAGNTAAEILGSSSRAAEKLKRAVAEASTAAGSSAPQAAGALRKTFSEVEKDLSFRLRVEAAQPEGFPSPTPVGEVAVKNYPAYRKAVAETGRSVAFWTLFSHIKRNGISMTAPVEMEYATDSRMKKMAFLYGEPTAGKPGKAGSVNVVDMKPMTVVSIGVRGIQSEEAVSGARGILEAWLDSNRNTWTADGPFRTMAYNSPFVPREQNFFEVQLPICEVREKATSSAGK